MGRILGIATGTLSLVFLAWKGFDIGLGPTALFILEYYEKLVHVFVGWTEPYLRSMLEQIESHLGINLDLHEHWRHVFVLMALYVSACTRSTWAAFPGTKIVAVIVGLLGFVISIVSSVASGTIEVVSGYSSLLLAAFPVLGVVCFELILSAIDREYFKNEGLKIGVVGIISSLIAVSLKHQLLGDDLKSVGLMALGIFTFLLSLYWVAYGAFEARNRCSRIYSC